MKVNRFHEGKSFSLHQMSDDEGVVHVVHAVHVECSLGGQ